MLPAIILIAFLGFFCLSAIVPARFAALTAFLVLILGGFDTTKTVKAASPESVFYSAQNVMPPLSYNTANKTENHADNEKAYANIPNKQFPVPQTNGVAIPYANADTQENSITYTYANTGFRSDYEKQLRAAGFEKKTDSVFIKETESNPLIVAFEEGEGELVIRMFTTRDPMKRYQNIPDKRIPYPLDGNALAAEFAEYQAPNEASSETVYVYYNKPKSFVADYETRLRNAGFENVRIPESPLYVKKIDENIELTVAIDVHKDNKVYVDLRIKMMAVRLNNH